MTVKNSSTGNCPPPGGGSSYLEPGGPGSDEAVVGMPVEGGHSRLDRLLDVLRHPPVVLL